MIRAGRDCQVRTLTDLAAAAGKSAKSFRNQRLHKVPGHPEPISSARARVLLWDGEQVDAFHAGRPVPALPEEDSRDDLLDRNEAAELADVEPRTWDRYANLPGMRPRPDLVAVAEVDHWRRGEVLDWLDDRPGPGSSPGRPVGSREAASPHARPSCWSAIRPSRPPQRPLNSASLLTRRNVPSHAPARLRYAGYSRMMPS
ncbi:hypothetical protein [Streptomyces sp. RK9]|uniref:hypothetical protein n=1 Tax=Streptomyces sp. RK9 TaxID=3239284 RepID=UPI0038658CE1